MIEENRIVRPFSRAAPHLISNLRLLPELKWAALGDLYRMENKEQYPLKEWEEAVSYLLGCEVRFNNYEEIGKSLKPFSLEVK